MAGDEPMLLFPLEETQTSVAVLEANEQPGIPIAEDETDDRRSRHVRAFIDWVVVKPPLPCVLSDYGNCYYLI